MNAIAKHRDDGPPSRAALSIPEAARALGVSTDTIRRRLDDGTLHSFRLGPSTRITVEEIARIRGEQVPA